jgi:hypothetical protein
MDRVGWSAPRETEQPAAAAQPLDAAGGGEIAGNDSHLRIYSDVAADKHKWDWAGLGAVVAAG